MKNIRKKENINDKIIKTCKKRMVVIKKESSRQFLQEFNKNQVTKEFMDSCKKAGELFERTRKKENAYGKMLCDQSRR
ncbi:hypothetical protein [Anaerostipes hadrus]|uniref:hypothetical protein n=1 Tax=Anaerostipes hadrus TaxID=649756 RepID=UPI0012D80457|nr:hypothetical protein [Anaerostipes hadrus]